MIGYGPRPNLPQTGKLPPQNVSRSHSPLSEVHGRSQAGSLLIRSKFASASDSFFRRRQICAGRALILALNVRLREIGHVCTEQTEHR